MVHEPFGDSLGDSPVAGDSPGDSPSGSAGPLVGVFDSGLGGLTVLRALIDLLPGADTIYFGDTGRFPYGPKPPGVVRRFAVQIADLLVTAGADLLVVACNTAASVALADLQARHPGVPVIGVVEPGLAAAARVTSTGRVGVIGTVGTIRSGAYQEAAARHHPAVELSCAACPGFVEFVEAGEVDSDQVHVLAERLLAPLREAKIDTLVLGCTHYPLLARTIADVMGPDVVLVSSADETAFAVRAMLPAAARPRPAAGSGPGTPHRPATHRFVTSGDPATFRRLGARFLGPEVIDVEAHRWS